MPAQNVSITANYTTIDYTVTVDGDNGTETGGGTYNIGDTVTLSATPDSGYTFDGWTVNSGGVTIVNDSFAMPAQNVSITANYISAFTPGDITTNGWWDVSDNSTITETSGVVTSISDKSGNGITLTANSSGTNNHTLITAGQNGLNVIDFDGDDRYNAQGVSSSNGDCQFFIVCRVDVVDNVSDSILSCVSPTTSFQFQAGSASDFTATLIGPDTTTTSSEDFKGSYHIYNAHFDLQGSQQTSFVDGSIVGASSYVTALNNTISLRVFSNRGHSQYPTGRLCEIIIAEDVTLVTRQKVEGYLAHKWGLQGNLDPSHPYKAQPPS